MAIRFDTSPDNLNRSTGLPAFGDLTVAFWLYRIASGGDESVWAIGDTSGFGNYIGAYISGGLFLDVNIGGTGTGVVAGSTLALSTWYHYAMVFDNTANVVTNYLNAVQDAQKTGVTGTTTWGYEDLSRSGVLFNGRVTAFKAWTAALSVDDLRNEMRACRPIRSANLHRWTPLLTHTDLGDISGVSGVAWTAGGTLTTEQGPPIPWDQGRRRVLVPTAVVGPDLTLTLGEPPVSISTF